MELSGLVVFILAHGWAPAPYRAVTCQEAGARLCVRPRRRAGRIAMPPALVAMRLLRRSRPVADPA